MCKRGEPFYCIQDTDVTDLEQLHKNHTTDAIPSPPQDLKDNRPLCQPPYQSKKQFRLSDPINRRIIENSACAASGQPADLRSLSSEEAIMTLNSI